METTQFKDNVKTAAAYLERAGINVPHTQLLEAISKAFGERNWSTMRALLENPPAPASVVEEEASAAEVLNWTPAQGLMPEELFVRHGGERCPVCGSNNIEADGIQADGPDAWEENKCHSPTCGSTWTTNYDITGYAGVNLGKNAPPYRQDVIDELVEDVKRKAHKYEFSVHSEDEARDLVETSAEHLGIEPNDDEIALAVEALLS